VATIYTLSTLRFNNPGSKGVRKIGAVDGLAREYPWAKSLALWAVEIDSPLTIFHYLMCMSCVLVVKIRLGFSDN
jgi:hypothetical protein